MLKVWGRPNSFNVQKVLWLLGELGLDYEHIPAGGDAGLVDTPEFLAMNPHGRVPVINDEGLLVWESHTVLRYLAARYGAGRFWDQDAGRRSAAERWMDWSQTSLQPDFLVGVFWAYYRTPAAQRDIGLIRKHVESCSRHFLLLDRILATQAFLGSDEFSLADIPAGTALYRYFELDIQRPPLANVGAWYQRLQSRPAYREHVMRPFDELYGRLDF